MSEKSHSIVTEEIEVLFLRRQGKLIGSARILDLAFDVIPLEPEKDCTIKIQPHENWDDDGWTDLRTGLDVPYPRPGECWTCVLRRLWYAKGTAVWVAMPVEFLSYGY